MRERTCRFTLLAETLEETRTQAKARIQDLEAERKSLERDLGRHNAELRKLAGRLATDGTATDRVADLQDRIRAAEQRSTQIREELITLGRDLVDEKEVARALAVFDPVWESLTPREQVRVIRLLVQRVDYDGGQGTVSVTFHPARIKMLARELAEEAQRYESSPLPNRRSFLEVTCVRGGCLLSCDPEPCISDTLS